MLNALIRIWNEIDFPKINCKLSYVLIFSNIVSRLSWLNFRGAMFIVLFDCGNSSINFSNAFNMSVISACRFSPLKYIKFSFQSVLISIRFVLLAAAFPFSLWKIFNILFPFSQYSRAFNLPMLHVLGCTTAVCGFKFAIIWSLNIVNASNGFEEFLSKCCLFGVSEIFEYLLFSLTLLNKMCIRPLLGDSLDCFKRKLFGKHPNKSILSYKTEMSP